MYGVRCVCGGATAPERRAVTVARKLPHIMPVRHGATERPAATPLCPRARYVPLSEGGIIPRRNEAASSVGGCYRSYGRNGVPPARVSLTANSLKKSARSLY